MILSKCVRLACAAGLALGLSTAASAHYNSYGDWDVNADPGTYAPVVLGDTISLDACASSYFDYNHQSDSYSLCQLSDLSAFSLKWYAKQDGDAYWTALTSTFSGNNAPNGLNVSIATGAGSFFSEVGTYFIGLYVAVANNAWVLLPSGNCGNYGYGYSNNYNGVGNSDFTSASAFSVEGGSGGGGGGTTTVPEPMAALLLLPGFLMIARRERRRKAPARRG